MSIPLRIFKDSLGLKYSGPICEIDSTSERVPANDFLSSSTLDSYAIGSRRVRCIAGGLGQCKVDLHMGTWHEVVY